MPYLPTGVLVVVGLVLAVILMVRLRGAGSRFGAVRDQLSRHVHEEAGLLRARSAAVKVAAGQRFGQHRRVVGAGGDGAPREAPSQV